MVVVIAGIPVGLVVNAGGYAGSVVFYLFYICYSCCTNSTKYICNVVDIAQVFVNIDAAIEAPPEIHWTIQNYHYETRVEHYTDSEGNS